MRLSLVVLVVVISSLLLVQPLAAQTKVTRAPATVTTRMFDPKRPPADMPPLNRDEAAVTQTKFACGVKLEVEIAQAGDEKPTARIAGVDATLKLDVIIWLPVGVSAKIRAHEDGHRQISELYYAKAEQAARELAAKYVGKTLDIPGVEPAQTQPIIERAANEFCGEYLGRIEVPSQAAQEKYDLITEHGRNRLSEKEAIRRATAGATSSPSAR
jgi:hypothetical protein